MMAARGGTLRLPASMQSEAVYPFPSISARNESAQMQLPMRHKLIGMPSDPGQGKPPRRLKTFYGYSDAK
jgi:hypothetical protein